MDWIQTLNQTSQTFLAGIADFLPDLLGAILILLIGWLIAKGLRKLFVLILNKIKFDRLVEKSGIKRFLEQGGIDDSPTQITGSIIYIFLMLIVFISAFNVLELDIVSQVLVQILLYIPKIIAAIAVLVVGFWIGSFADSAISSALRKNNFNQANLMGDVAKVLVYVFTITAAISILGIADAIVATAFLLILGSASLAIALAFGIGGAPIAQEWIRRQYEKERNSPDNGSSGSNSLLNSNATKTTTKSRSYKSKKK